ncbi:MAG: phosphate ABC transporter substrate-binding protein [Magnetococcales bacterium]|nr:phosphate ABC transporter substrate-binding protein [Magnetococcales bacterium]
MQKKTLTVAAVAAAALVALTATVEARTMIQNKGSDTLVNVAQAWAEEYQKIKPEVAIAVTGGGTGTGIAALINNTVDIANASREIKQKEIDSAKANGVTPVEHVVGFDALAVYVHKSNPMETISVEQLADMYGEGGKTKKWSDIGVTVPECKGQKIILVSRQNNSGTYVYFRERVLGEKRDFVLGTKDMHGSKDVVDLVEHTPCAIGYSGLAYATPGIKMLKISEKTGTPGVAPTMEAAINKTYPVARSLLMYTPGEPKGDVKTYMEWIKSDVGQCILQSKGYAPFRPVTCKP